MIIIALVIIAIILLGPLQMQKKFMKMLYPREYENFVKVYAEQYQVDENLIYAIIKAESNFDKKAVSSKGAKGLMQLMEETAKDIAPKLNNPIDTQSIDTKLLEVDANIQLGTKYIAILLEKYKNTSIAVVAYNAGTGTVDEWIQKGVIQKDGSDIEKVPYKETNQYVRKILQNYKIYQNLYEPLDK